MRGGSRCGASPWVAASLRAAERRCVKSVHTVELEVGALPVVVSAYSPAYVYPIHYLVRKGTGRALGRLGPRPMPLGLGRGVCCLVSGHTKRERPDVRRETRRADGRDGTAEALTRLHASSTRACMYVPTNARAGTKRSENVKTTSGDWSRALASRPARPCDRLTGEDDVRIFFTNI